MKKLLMILIATAVCAVAVAGTAPQAKATDGGSYSTNPCPPWKPYVHVNAFGMAYCSIYP
jgi:hypothetical protein